MDIQSVKSPEKIFPANIRFRILKSDAACAEYAVRRHLNFRRIINYGKTRLESNQ